MASGTDFQGNSGQAAIDRFAAMMIERMQQMKDTGWKQGWIGGASGYAGLPQNVGGRNYSGSNSFFLQMHTAAMNYQLPVYLTFKQAHNLKAHVLKGEKAFPVVYWDMMIKDSHGKRISTEEYRAMSKEEKKDMDVIPFIKSFPVYNVAQTNLAEVQPGEDAEAHGQVQGSGTSGYGRYVHPCRTRPYGGDATVALSDTCRQT